MKEIFPGVFQIENKLATTNPVKDYRPFSEEIVSKDKKQYRVWDPTRSKFAAAITNGIKEFPLKEGTKILYLGIAHGYSASFLSNIIGNDGIIYGVEFSDRCFKKLLPITEKYKNIVPILEDARFPKRFSIYEKVDVICEDIADRDLTNVAILNCKEFLKKNGYLLLSIKARSIDVVANPKQVVKEEIKKLENAGFTIIDWKMLDPYEKDHGFVIATLK